MKPAELKNLIRAIITEAVTGLQEMAKDPDHDEMMQFLQQKYRGLISPKDLEFDAEEAIYWFAYENHGGQWSNLYSVLSTSPFEPGPIGHGPKSEVAQDMKADLEQEFGNGQVKEDGGAGGGSGGAGGAGAGVSVGNTTAAVQGYNTPRAFKRKKNEEVQGIARGSLQGNERKEYEETLRWAVEAFQKETNKEERDRLMYIIKVLKTHLGL